MLTVSINRPEKGSVQGVQRGPDLERSICVGVGRTWGNEGKHAWMWTRQEF